MTDKTVGERLKALEAQARDAGRLDLAMGYEHAATIIEAAGTEAATNIEQDVSGVPIADAKSFCDRHCFVGRRDGPGKADDCSICPLATFTLGVIDDDDQDDGELERKRAERVRREAATIHDKLDEMGAETLAAESHVARRGDGLQPVDG